MVHSQRTRIHRTVTTVSLTGALLGGIVGLSSAALAASTTAPDAAGDVVGYTGFDRTEQDPVATPAPDRTNGDITSIRSVHFGRRVAVKVSYADLTKTGDATVTFLRIVTNEGLGRNMFVAAGPGGWARGQARLENRRGTKQKCRTGHTIDYDTNTITMRVPRTCLSNPRWVRIGFETATVEDGGDSVFFDDALRDSAPSPEDQPTLGERLLRGTTPPPPPAPSLMAPEPTPTHVHPDSTTVAGTSAADARADASAAYWPARLVHATS